MYSKSIGLKVLHTGVSLECLHGAALEYDIVYNFDRMLFSLPYVSLLRSARVLYLVEFTVGSVDLCIEVRIGISLI